MYNANNYGYNPYGVYMPQRPMSQPVQNSLQTSAESFQPMQNRPALSGKIVDAIDTVKGIDIPLDGSCSYFPLASGEAIVTKQLQMDGTSKITIYKPVIEDKKDMPKFITKDDLEEILDEYGLIGLDDLKDDINTLKKEIKDMHKKKVKSD